MKSRTPFAAAVLCALAFSAHANGIGNTPTAVGVGVGIAGAISSSTSGAVSNVNVQGDAASRMPASTAYAAGLSAANGTCLGSASGGLQGMGAGVSFGSTKLDEGCDTRYDIGTLLSLGLRDAAIARACMKPELAQSMGATCPKPAPVAGYSGNDPYVQARLAGK